MKWRKTALLFFVEVLTFLSVLELDEKQFKMLK